MRLRNLARVEIEQRTPVRQLTARWSGTLRALSDVKLWRQSALVPNTSALRRLSEETFETRSNVETPLFFPAVALTQR